MNDRKFRQVLPVFALLVNILLLTACGSGPPPKLYLLEPLLEPVSAETQLPVAKNNVDGLGIAQVKLPGYAEDARIASRDDSGSVIVEDDHRWAEDPADAITRVLADRLRHHVGTTVLTEPWPRGYEPTARVEVIFDRFLREPFGGADMAGQIHLISGDGRSLIKVLPFQFVYYGRADGFAEFFIAASQGINDVARMAAKSLITYR